MTARASFRQADLEKAIRVAQAAGLTVSEYSIGADGTIHVRVASGPPGDDFDLVDMRR